MDTPQKVSQKVKEVESEIKDLTYDIGQKQSFIKQSQDKMIEYAEQKVYFTEKELMEKHSIEAANVLLKEDFDLMLDLQARLKELNESFNQLFPE